MTCLAASIKRYIILLRSDFSDRLLGLPEGELAGRWRRDHAREGITLSQADCLIAAAAHGIGARLATGNPKHFPMPQLDVEHWPVGE